MPPGEEEAAVQFYGDVLGLDTGRRSRRSWRRAAASGSAAPSIEVHLGVEDRFQPGERRRTRRSSSGRLGRAPGPDRARPAIRVSEDEVQLEGFHRVYVRDPFGNRLELIEPV